MKKYLRFLPVLLIVGLMAFAYFSGAYKTITFDNLRQHHRELQVLVDDEPYMAPFLFMLVYIAATTLSIPGGIFLSLIGGYLFHQPYCTIYVVVAATIGATLLFLAARFAFGKSLKEKASPWLGKMKKGFNENATR